MKFFSLILELTNDEAALALSTERIKTYRDFGPMFKENRTVIKEFDYSLNDLLQRINVAKIKNDEAEIEKLQSDAERKIRRHLGVHAYGIDIDLKNNLVAYSKGGKGFAIKLGKLLGKMKPEMLSVVISHHPVDIAGQSTDKQWRSCTQIRNGDFKDSPFENIKYGDMVAYLIKGPKSQVNDILNDHKPEGLAYQNTLARISIKRFVDTEHEDSFAFQAEERMYHGIGIEDELLKIFEDSVDDALEKSNISTEKYSPAVLRIPAYSDAYTDTFENYSRMNYDESKLDEYSDDDLFKLLSAKPLLFQKLKDPSEDLIYRMIHIAPGIYAHVKNPTEGLQIVLVENFPRQIKLIKDPSPKVQMVAIRRNTSAIENIDNPTIEVQEYVASKTLGWYNYLHKRFNYNLNDRVTKTAFKKLLTEPHYVHDIERWNINNFKVAETIFNPKDFISYMSFRNIEPSLEVYILEKYKDPRFINAFINAVDRKTRMKYSIDMIHENPFVIKMIDFPTTEEMYEAMKTLPEVGYDIIRFKSPTTIILFYYRMLETPPFLQN